MQHGVNMESSVKRGRSCLNEMHGITKDSYIGMDRLNGTGTVVPNDSDYDEARVVVTSETGLFFS